jgi:molybdenum cofactor synthesis domain-containing protein
MIPLDQARRTVLDACPVLAARVMPLRATVGCVAAESVHADATIPAFANSAMDGYALRSADTRSGPMTLRVVGVTRAGSGPGSVGSGEAVRIMTGAPLPSGADAVCMQEATRPGAEPDTVEIDGPVERGTFVRFPGDDLRQGQLVFPAGTVLGPAHVGMLASLGRVETPVFPRPVVGVLSTGDELLDPPARLVPGCIRDGNRPSLLGLLHQSGFGAVDLGMVADDELAIAGALGAAAAECDAVVVSGGVSVGDADLVTAVLDRLCAGTSRWMQVAIRPAKPFAFGLLGGRVPVFAVPGNPVSAMVSFELLVRPALRHMAGHETLDRPVARAVADGDLFRPADGKVHYLRVRASFGDDGRIHVRPTGLQQSHVLSAMALANALAVVSGSPGVLAGDDVDVLLLDPDSLADESGALATVDDTAAGRGAC